MYLPNRVSTSASWGLSTLRPNQGIHPIKIQMIPTTVSRIPKTPPSQLPKITKSMAAMYSTMLPISTVMPFFLFWRMISSVFLVSISHLRLRLIS